MVLVYASIQDSNPDGGGACSDVPSLGSIYVGIGRAHAAAQGGDRVLLRPVGPARGRRLRRRLFGTARVINESGRYPAGAGGSVAREEPAPTGA